VNQLQANCFLVDEKLQPKIIIMKNKKKLKLKKHFKVKKQKLGLGMDVNNWQYYGGNIHTCVCIITAYTKELAHKK
jgi:hypothetical protein